MLATAALVNKGCTAVDAAQDRIRAAQRGEIDVGDIPEAATEYQTEIRATKKFEGTILNETRDLKIKLSNPQFQQDGFLGSHKYITYTVKTFPLNYEVERKDKDFNILRDLLVKKCPHLLIPACPDHYS